MTEARRPLRAREREVLSLLLSATLLPIALMIGLTGCGATDEAGPTSTRGPVRHITMPPPPPPPQEVHGIEIGAGVPNLDVERSRDMINLFYDNFGGGSPVGKDPLYDYIEAVGVNGYDNRTTIQTSLQKRGETTYNAQYIVYHAQNICRWGNGAGAMFTRVTDIDGRTLVEC